MDKKIVNIDLMIYKIGLKSDRIDTGVHPIGQSCRQTVAPICVNHFSMQTLIGQFEDVSNLWQAVAWICVNCISMQTLLGSFEVVSNSQTIYFNHF